MRIGWIVVLSDVIIELMNHISSFDCEREEIGMHLLHQIKIEIVKSGLGLYDYNVTDSQHDVEIDWKKGEC